MVYRDIHGRKPVALLIIIIIIIIIIIVVSSQETGEYEDNCSTILFAIKVT